jgi:flavin-dependent dehydrogenase
MKEPINIIGAGPAGLTAAIAVARSGGRARVYEMAGDVGHRLNGDFQGLENWSSMRDVTDLLKDLGLEINFHCVPYYGGVVYGPEGKAVTTASERPIFYLVRRGSMPGSLDVGLKEQALSAGVEILFHRRIDRFEGPAIVGTGPKGANAVAAGVTFETDLKDQAVVVLDDSIAPKGYAYLLVNRGLGTMVTVLYREFERANEYFDATMRYFRNIMTLDIRNEKKFGCKVNFFLRDSQARANKLFVGESAGFQDFLWGFGMRYAMVSGHLAAKSVMEGSDYDALWKKELQPMLETSLVNRYLLEKCGHAGYRYLVRRFAKPDMRGFLRRQYNYSFFKRLLFPLAKINYESRVKDASCTHEDCTCV